MDADAPTSRHLTPRDERRVAVAAGDDPRTIRRYLAPVIRARMRSTTRARVERALRVPPIGAVERVGVVHVAILRQLPPWGRVIVLLALIVAAVWLRMR
jgi:hypothetical protein